MYGCRENECLIIRASKNGAIRFEIQETAADIANLQRFCCAGDCLAESRKSPHVESNVGCDVRLTENTNIVRYS